MMKKQSIFNELHAVREQLLAESGGTLSGLVARIQAEQKASGRSVFKKLRGVATSKMTTDEIMNLTRTDNVAMK